MQWTAPSLEHTPHDVRGAHDAEGATDGPHVGEECQSTARSPGRREEDDSEDQKQKSIGSEQRPPGIRLGPVEPPPGSTRRARRRVRTEPLSQGLAEGQLLHGGTVNRTRSGRVQDRSTLEADEKRDDAQTGLMALRASVEASAVSQASTDRVCTYALVATRRAAPHRSQATAREAR